MGNKPETRQEIRPMKVLSRILYSLPHHLHLLAEDRLYRLRMFPAGIPAHKDGLTPSFCVAWQHSVSSK